QARASSPEIKVDYNVQLIERTPTTDGNIFTVTYTSDADDLALASCNNRVCKKSVASRVPSDGSWMVSFKVPHDATKAYLRFSAINGDYHRFMTIMMDNNRTESLSQALDSTMLQDIRINPPAEVVYKPGENVNVTVGFPYPNDQNEMSLMNATRGGIWYAFLCDIKMQKFKRDLWPRHFIKLSPEPPENEYSKLRKNRTYIITPKQPMSGYVVFKQTLTLPFNTRIWLFQSYVVRPADQKGPFPDGSIVVSFSYRNATCKYEQKCIQHCMFLGADVIGLNVKEVLPDGTEGEVTTKSYGLPFYDQGGIWKHARVLHWLVEAQRDAGRNQSVIIKSYKCFAFARTSGKNATGVVQVELTD
ncbi:hypothetical protein PoB_004690000, partial [Plakobranchus ocellatus]